MVKELGKENDIDRSYYDKLVNEAVETISQYGDFEWFASDDPYVPIVREIPPWFMPCGIEEYTSCFECPNFHSDQFDLCCELGHDISGVVMDKVESMNKNKKEM
jgi:hypothetical protein